MTDNVVWVCSGCTRKQDNVLPGELYFPSTFQCDRCREFRPNSVAVKVARKIGKFEEMAKKIGDLPTSVLASDTPPISPRNKAEFLESYVKGLHEEISYEIHRRNNKGGQQAGISRLAGVSYGALCELERDMRHALKMVNNE